MKKAKIENPDDHFEVITSAAKSILSPSKKLLKWWKKREELIKSGNGPERRHPKGNLKYSLTIEFVDFRRKYEKEIKSSIKANLRIAELIKISKTKTVWLVCYEKEYPCHRFILEDMISTILLRIEHDRDRFKAVEPKYGTRHTSISAPNANADGTCARPECNTPRPKWKQKYCSGECAQLSFWERNWEGFRFMCLVRDNYKCVTCSDFVYLKWYTYSYLMSSKAIKGITSINPKNANSDYDFAFLKLVKKYNSEYPAIYHREWIEQPGRFNGFYKDIPENLKKANTDHIIPIYKGGHSMDLDNLQTLCEDCHKIKTRDDMSTPASRDKREKKEIEIHKLAEIEKDQTSLEAYYD